MTSISSGSSRPSSKRGLAMPNCEPRRWRLMLAKARGSDQVNPAVSAPAIVIRGTGNFEAKRFHHGPPASEAIHSSIAASNPPIHGMTKPGPSFLRGSTITPTRRSKGIRGREFGEFGGQYTDLDDPLGRRQRASNQVWFLGTPRRPYRAMGRQALRRRRRSPPQRRLPFRVKKDTPLLHPHGESGMFPFSVFQ